MKTSKYYLGQLLSAGMSAPDAVKQAKSAGFNVSWDPVNNNIGLDDTRDGYIGLRPHDRSDPNSPLGWQWMAYNNSVQPPGGFKNGDINSDTRVGGTGGTGGPGGNGGLGGNGANGISSSLSSLLGGLDKVQLGQFFGPPDPGATNQVGQDPFSQLLTGGIADIINRSGYDEKNKNLRLESLQEDYNRARKFQLSQDRATLADRGLLSEPGHAQGPEVTALSRLEETLSPIWAEGIRNALGDANDRASQNYLTALGLGTQRQQILSDIAVRNLEQNRLWNQFLAQHGLDRDRIMYELQNGQMEALAPLLLAFSQFANISSGGFI
jgi:hypothetical protein